MITVASDVATVKNFVPGDALKSEEISLIPWDTNFQHLPDLMNATPAEAVFGCALILPLRFISALRGKQRRVE